MALEMEKFDLKKISTREKMIVAFTLISALGYGYYQFEYVVQGKKMKDAMTRLSQVDASAAALEQALAKLKAVGDTEKQIARKNESISRLREEIEAVKAKMKGSATEVVQEIQSKAEALNIVISTMRTRERNFQRGKLKMKEISLILELHCGYTAMKKFLEFLDAYPALLSIESFQMIRNEEILPKIENRLHIKIFAL